MCDLKHVRTEILRATLSQEITKLLDKTDGTQHRRVQVIVPAAPQVFVAVDVKEGDDGDVGTNKVYNLPIFHPGQPIEFPLGCAQTLSGACASGFAPVTLIIEYYVEMAR